MPITSLLGDYGSRRLKYGSRGVPIQGLEIWAIEVCQARRTRPMG